MLTPVTRIVDHCINDRSTPTPLSYSTLTGLVFSKGSSDTINGALANPRYDDRWESCHLPSRISSSRYHTQMTMAIYVR